jgi:hypothetical protein
MLRRNRLLSALSLAVAIWIGGLPSSGWAAKAPADPQPVRIAQIFEPADPPIEKPAAKPHRDEEIKPIVLPLPPALWSGLSALMALGAIAGFKRWRFKRSVNRE